MRTFITLNLMLMLILTQVRIAMISFFKLHELCGGQCFAVSRIVTFPMSIKMNTAWRGVFNVESENAVLSNIIYHLELNAKDRIVYKLESAVVLNAHSIQPPSHHPALIDRVRLTTLSECRSLAHSLRMFNLMRPWSYTFTWVPLCGFHFFQSRASERARHSLSYGNFYILFSRFSHSVDICEVHAK